MKTVNGYLIQPNADLRDAHLSDANLSGANLSDADLVRGDLSDANLSDADLSDADLRGTGLIAANLSRVNLSRANLSRANLSKANLHGANLSRANLSDANLSGVNLTKVDLSGAIGIGTKKEEIKFAKELLIKLENPLNGLEMEQWHTCDTVHCIAGWAFPDLNDPGQRASLAYPTLAQYFFSSNEKAMGALKRVASGEESVFN